MRITTSMYYDTALQGMLRQQAQLDTLTAQVASGQKVQTPQDNPAAYASATRLEVRIQGYARYQADANSLSSRLSLGTQTLGDALTVLDRVRAVALQAANGTTNASNRKALAAQVASARSELLNLANTRAPDGHYLFAGSRGQTAPFQELASGQVVYRGDAGRGAVAIAPNLNVNDLLTGAPFATPPSGNGYASVTAAASNTGAANVTLQGVYDLQAATAFHRSGTPYTVAFSGSGGSLSYTVSQGGTTVQSGQYQSGMTLNVAGVQYQIKGTPAAGDSFTLSPSRPQSLFATLSNLVTALGSPTDTAAEKAQMNQKLDGVLASLQQGETAITALQARLGVSLRAVRTASNSDAGQSTQLQSARSDAVDVNWPQALTALNQHQMALQAAMGAFAKISKLSLFNYV